MNLSRVTPGPTRMICCVGPFSERSSHESIVSRHRPRSAVMLMAGAALVPPSTTATDSPLQLAEPRVGSRRLPGGARGLPAAARLAVEMPSSNRSRCAPASCIKRPRSRPTARWRGSHPTAATSPTRAAPPRSASPTSSARPHRRRRSQSCAAGARRSRRTRRSSHTSKHPTRRKSAPRRPRSTKRRRPTGCSGSRR